MSANDNFILVMMIEELSFMMMHLLDGSESDSEWAIKEGVTKGRMVYTGFSQHTGRKSLLYEKERMKARTLLLMAVPKDHSRRFHGMDDAKEIWAAIKTRFSGNANSKKMQKAVLKQQFKAFTISSKESLEKGYDRFQKLLSQLDCLELLGLPCDTTNADDVDLIHEDLDQIDDLDLEEMDINWQIAMTAIKIKKFYKKTGKRPRVDGKMHVAFDKRKVECFNCHNTGHFARECKFKGSKEGSRQEAGRGQDFKPVRTEKEALMTIDEGQINWVEQTADEELEAVVLGYEEKISRGIFAFRETDAGNYHIPLYNRFKQPSNARTNRLDFEGKSNQ
ncbi:ribonuclease H-like domain-containing protein [Tanacetum coccineum]